MTSHERVSPSAKFARNGKIRREPHEWYSTPIKGLSRGSVSDETIGLLIRELEANGWTAELTTSNLGITRLVVWSPPLEEDE